MNNYYGRYSHSTGFYTAPDGKRYKCSYEDYLEWVGKHRGLEVARRLKQLHSYRERDKKKNSKKIKFNKSEES